MAYIKQLKVKKQSTGYLLFISEFMKNNAKRFKTVQDAISEGI